jgi:hypothetical protein
VPIVMTRTGKQNDLIAFTKRDNNQLGGNWDLHLYTNNFTPNDNVTFADFIEAAFAGYVPQHFGAWSVALPASGNPAVAINANNNTFQPSVNPPSPVTVYGYWVQENSPSVVILFAELLATPFIFTFQTDQLILVPQIKCDTF